MSEDHAERMLQPSSFKRTMNCPGWGQFCERNNIPPSKTNVYAAEGSVAHHLGERCITRNESPYTYVGKTGWYNNGRCGIQSSDIAPLEEKGEHFVFTIDDAMAEAVDVYVQECRRKRKKSVGAKFMTETKFDLNWLAPGMFGTSDHTIVEPLGTLYVDDYKHGAGVVVEVGASVGDNPQLTIYALGALGENNPHMVEEVTVTIVQPRAPHPGGAVRSITFPVEDLEVWGRDVLKPAVEAARKEDAPLHAGPWCQWCSAENVVGKDGLLLCPAKRAAVLDSAKTMFGKEVTIASLPDITAPDPATFSGERLGKVIIVEEMFASFIAAAKAEACRRLEEGSPDAPPNLKLVAGKMSNRAWGVDDAKVYNAVKTKVPRSAAYIEKIGTPVQIERALKKAGLKPKEAAEFIAPLLAERTPGRPLMVPIDDNREALPPKKEIMFSEDSNQYVQKHITKKEK